MGTGEAIFFFGHHEVHNIYKYWNVHTKGYVSYHMVGGGVATYIIFSPDVRSLDWELHSEKTSNPHTWPVTCTIVIQDGAMGLNSCHIMLSQPTK